MNRNYYTNPRYLEDEVYTLNRGIRPRARDYQIDRHEAQNRRQHHTSEFERGGLIVRRGQIFRLTFDFDRAIDLETDILILQFSIGETPLASKGTLLRLFPTNDLQETKWGYKVAGLSRTSVSCDVMSASDTIVGTYDIDAELIYPVVRGSNDKKRLKLKTDVTILFNAWCKDDTVYVANEEERYEYVLNETGVLFLPAGVRHWAFDQFRTVCLDAALYILDISYLRKESHGNPVLVTRCLSAMVNSNDEQGVVEGKWFGNYSPHTHPSKWTGSEAILEQYLITKRPVKYGQCAVFSAVLTTVSRALGIPTRSITNLNSAHDTDGSLTCDSYFDADGRPLNLSNDSIWNYHMWNEGFFRRPDLPSGHDGWQVFDSTPQELSSKGLVQCGPTPVKAVRNGAVFIPYETAFVFTEVNGDQVLWQVARNSQGATVNMRPIQVDARVIGTAQLTKAVGSNRMEDITHHYKYPEGSEEEREIMQRAVMYGNDKMTKEKRRMLLDLYKPEYEPLVFDFDGRASPSGDIHLRLRIENRSGVPKEVESHIYAHAKYYTGVIGEDIGEFVGNHTAPPNKAIEIPWDISAATYLPNLDADTHVTFFIMVRVLNSKQTFVKEKEFAITLPRLILQVSDPRVLLGNAFDVAVQFENTLAVDLTDCSLKLEGPGIQKQMDISIRNVIAAKEGLLRYVTLIPRLPGRREIIANLYCKQLAGVTGSVTVDVVHGR